MPPPLMIFHSMSRPAQWLDLVNITITAVALRNPKLRKAPPIGYLDNREAITVLQDTFQEILNTVANDPQALGDGLDIPRDHFIHQTTPLPDALTDYGKVTLIKRLIRGRLLRTVAY